MNKSGPIIIIEDDQDDQDLISGALKEVDFVNEVIFFSDVFPDQAKANQTHY